MSEASEVSDGAVDHSDAMAILSVLYKAMQYEDGEVILSRVLFNGIPVPSVHLEEGGENYLLAVLVTPEIQEHFATIRDGEVDESGAGEG